MSEILPNSPSTVNPQTAATYLHNQANLYLSQKKLQEAIAACQQVLKLEPNWAVPYKTLGIAMQLQKNFEQAQHFYNQALQIQPDFAEVYANLGSLYAEHKKWDEAVNSYQKAIDLNPNFAGVYRNLAKIFQKLGHLDDMTECQYKAMVLEPSRVSYEDCVNLANQLLQQNKHQQAIECYQQALQKKTDGAEAYSNLGETWTRLKNWQAAKEAYQKALEISPKLIQPNFGLGNALIEQGLFEEAIACFRHLIEIHPSYYFGYQKLGEILLRLQQRQEAITMLQKAVEIDPNLPWAYSALAHAFLQENQLEDAIACCRKSIALKPEMYWQYEILGDALSQKQEGNEAIIAYIYGLKNQPQPLRVGISTTLNQKLGNVIRKSAPLDVESARQWYQESLQPSSEFLRLNKLGFTAENPEQWLEVAKGLAKYQQFEGALLFYQIAQLIQPDNLQIQQEVQQVSQEKEQFDKTLESYQRAIKISPNSPQFYTQMGNFLKEQGQSERAIQYHQKAHELRGWNFSIERNYEFICDWFSANIPIWTKYLNPLIDQPEINVLEIGSFQGMSTCWFLDYILTHATARITCVDPYFKPEFYSNIAKTGAAEKVTKLVGFSQNVLGSLKADTFDVVYIDGCHLATVVLEDSLMTWNLAKIGSIIIFDDYELPDPDQPEQACKKGVDYFLNLVGDDLEILYKSYQIIARKTGKGLSETEVAEHLKTVSVDLFQ